MIKHWTKTIEIERVDSRYTEEVKLIKLGDWIDVRGNEKEESSMPLCFWLGKLSWLWCLNQVENKIIANLGVTNELYVLKWDTEMELSGRQINLEKGLDTHTHTSEKEKESERRI